MIVTLFALLQSVGPALPGSRTVSCDNGGREEIVVCARGGDADQFRIPEQFRDEPAEAPEGGVVIPIAGNINANLHVESGDGVAGATAERAMVTFSLPF